MCCMGGRGIWAYAPATEELIGGRAIGERLELQSARSCHLKWLAALATAEAGLGQLAAASAAARSALLNDFIFPLAMASPLLPPQPRVPPRPPVPDDPRAQFAAVQAELKAQAEAARAELERARARVAELEAEVARLKEGK